MNVKERLAAVVALEKPDRVPVGPLLDHYAATYAGITNAELLENSHSRIAAVLKTMRELGPWDITFLAETANGRMIRMGVPARVHFPGKELPPNVIHQVEEIELFRPEDYDLYLEKGLLRFLLGATGRLYPELGGFRGLRHFLSLGFELRKHCQMVRAAGAEPACGFILPGPFLEYFSLGRGMGAMSLDLYDRPEKVKAAGRCFVREFTQLAIRSASFTGVPRVFIGLSRSSPAFISPRHFEEFILPELEYMVHTLIEAGINPLLHCDTDWTRNFHFFRRFPPKKCILELDGFSDIRKAKEILGDRMAIMGDVPAYLLAFAPKDEVLTYCRKLIEEVGAEGGFILSSGCSLPANAKAENVKALREAVEEWGWSGRSV